MSVSVVNMTPEHLSDETYQDSEPNLAVDPVHPALIAASAFTPDPDPNASDAPIYISKDGGHTWGLRSIVPFCNGITGDITLRFDSTNEHLYVAYLQTDALGSDVAVARTDDTTFMSEMELISQIESGDQPYVEAATVLAGPDAGNDRVYVGYSDGWAQIHYSLDAAISQPGFKTVKIESRGAQDGIAYDNPQVRTAIHRDGIVYVVFYSVHIGGTPTPAVDVVVVRDDEWGTGAEPFSALKDSGSGADGKPGQRVVRNVAIGEWTFGQEGGEGELSIAVDPNDSSVVFVAWADQQPETGYTLHVRRSNDSGESWPETAELWTIPMAQNPALAVNAQGIVGFLYQQFIESRTGQHWQTHFRYKADGGVDEDLILATVPADTPVNTGKTYIGDYVHLMTVGNAFYGVFCANNEPDPSHFPHKVKYQRKHDFFTKRLLALDGVTEVPISIDPFFFKVGAIKERTRFLKSIFELAIDPLALLLPSEVYAKLIEKNHPHEPKVTAIRQAADRMSADERAFALARARMIDAAANEVEEALTGMK
jgi:hypothetical protein